MNSVGFLGPKATFTHFAVSSMFPTSEKVPFHTIPEVIDAVGSGEVVWGVVPLENALEGSVNLTIDYLIHSVPLHIVAELVTPIKQHLMVCPDNANNWRNITKVYSHSHAIAQCHKFLHQQFKGLELEHTSSTSAAAQFVSENPDLPIAAIANKMAAEEYKLKVVQENIHDYSHNHTRFVVLHKVMKNLETDNSLYKGDKTTLVITLPSDEEAGALHQVLSAFAWRKLNLSKIESRPMKTGLGHYFFIIDIEQKMDKVLIPGAIAELEALGCSIKVLGSYPYYQIK
ncbi:prephenate dehydratase [Bacillus sp. HMF5848]|uniref:prephenate dehydratase n=1 Tax=Bacillus sp. HMF5848 TaxID=2495421 RepID=UPI000F7B2CB5|nr:prephenate dehydratase [Bacillus sp. HMF5848]RSK28002.1 prephenate dehydratase [Bacillus sp. HMF5848]